MVSKMNESDLLALAKNQISMVQNKRWPDPEKPKEETKLTSDEEIIKGDAKMNAVEAALAH